MAGDEGIETCSKEANLSMQSPLGKSRHPKRRSALQEQQQTPLACLQTENKL